MIVPMKKLWVLTLRSNEESALYRLGRMGVLHLEPSSRNVTPALGRIREEITLLDSALDLCGPDAGLPVPGLSEAEITEKAVQLVTEARRVRERESRLRQLEDEQAAGGGPEADPAALHILEERGIQVTLRRALKDDLARIPDGLAWAVIESRGEERLLAFFVRGETVPPWLNPAGLPVRNSAELEGLIETERKALSELRLAVRELQSFSGCFRELRALLGDRLVFEEARALLEREGPVSVLVGYCPWNLASGVEDISAKAGWAVLVHEPGPDDPVPTLLRPTRTGRLFSPVMKLLSVLPGYREADPSALLAPFFALFTAMLLDDAGYGVLMLLAATLFRKRLRRGSGDAYRLLLVLGGATTVWGALHGNWFGLEALSGRPVLRAFALDVFAEGVPGSETLAVSLCLFIGTVHLSAARLMCALRKFPSRGAAGEVGWVLFLWGMYGLIQHLLNGLPLGRATYVLLAGGFLTAAVFAEGGATSGLSVSAWARNLPLAALNGLGSLSDLVSYLRLFAVGLASRMLSAAFNGLAANAWSTGTVEGWVLGGLIFVSGHTTNILLSAMAVLVHGVRLNLLEFSKHAGTEWSGTAYHPFAFKSPKAWKGVKP